MVNSEEYDIWNPNGVSVDSDNGLVYWAGKEGIFRAPIPLLDTNDIEEIFGDEHFTVQPYDVFIDWSQGILFWFPTSQALGREARL